VLSLNDDSAEPTGFLFHPNGTTAYVVVQHSTDPVGALVDDYNTDDLLEITGFSPVTAQSAHSFGAEVASRLRSESMFLFGFSEPLSISAF
jgi:secreted PhoX family phosphatase